MSLKAIFWVCGATVTATGVVLGLRNVARAVGIDSDRGCPMSHPLHPSDQRVSPPQVADASFSPDAFREELLK